jgi:hypothetical protein
MVYNAASCWSPRETAVLKSTLKTWLDQHTDDDTLRFYLYAASFIEGKSTRDVALRMQWILQHHPDLSTKCKNGLGHLSKDKLRCALDSTLNQDSGGVEHLSEMRKMLQNNDVLLKTTQKYMLSGDFATSKEHIKQAYLALTKILGRVKIVTTDLYPMPRLPVSLNTSLVDTVSV